MRRAISCEYCAPKSRTTIAWLSWDWVSTDEILRLTPPVANKSRTLTTGDTEEHRGIEVLCDPLCPLWLSHFYRTTIFTSFFGTTMTFATCLPASAARTFSLAS